MPTPTTMADLSTTAASNSPASTDTIASGDDVIRAIGAILRTTNAKGSDITSATTTDIGAATGEFVDVTGTTTITGLGTIAAGIVRTVRFTGALTLTHNATSLILPGGANITTANGDCAQFRSLGSGNWVCVAYVPAAGYIGAASTATLTNKTINLTSNTLTGTTAQFNTALSDGDFATLAGSETLTNKTLTNPSYSGATSNGGTVTTIDINGGTIDGTVIGGSSAASGTFTTLTSTGNATLGDDPAVDTHTINGGLTVKNTGSGNSLLIEDSASTDATPFIVNENGNVGIGTSALTGFNLRVSAPLTGATGAYGIASRGQTQSDVTASSYSFGTFPSFANFAAAAHRHYSAEQGTISGTLTTQYGFEAGSSLTGATNNYGFYSNIASGTGRWNFYANGTASNYFGGLIDISASTAGQIKFPASQNASADANCMDDYEEGSWTPSVGGTATYFSQYGKYVKIGRVVYVEFDIYINAIGTGSTIVVSGLPFTSANENPASGMFAHFFTGIASSVVFIAAYIAPNGTTAQLESMTAAGTAVSTNAIFTGNARVIAQGYYRV